MKKLIHTALVLGIVFCLTASASAQTCVPIPAKDSTGHVEVLHQGESLAVSYFEQNGCDWAGFDQLNGTDGTVIDLTGHTGTAGVTGTVGDTALLFVVVHGHFLDESCAPAGDWHVSTASPENPLTEQVPIPAGAKWMAVTHTTANNGNDIDLAVHTDEITCVKKKKKKRR